MELLGKQIEGWRAPVAGVAAIVLLSLLWSSGDDPVAAGPGEDGGFSAVARVEKRPFEATVVEQATIDARNSFRLSSLLPSNMAKVIYLAPEGVLIGEGEVVAKFDTTPFEEEIQELESKARDVASQLQQAAADMHLKRAEIEERKSKLSLSYAEEQQKLVKLTSITHPERLEREQKRLADMEKVLANVESVKNMEAELLDRGLTNKLKQQLAEEEYRDRLFSTEAARKAFKRTRDIAIPAEVKQAELRRDKSQVALTSFEQISGFQLEKLEASQLRLQHRLDEHERKIARYREMIEKTTILAPAKGLVLYQTMAFEGERRKVQVGDSLWNRQTFVVIPDMKSLVAFASVREAEVGRLVVGQPVTLQPEAYPDLALTGSIDTIGALASEEGTGANHFRVRIDITDVDERLRPGMNARATILTSQVDEALTVPVQAVFYEQEQTVCFLWRNGDPLRIAVALGASDGKDIVVSDGLEEGDEVMLVFPRDYDV